MKSGTRRIVNSTDRTYVECTIHNYDNKQSVLNQISTFFPNWNINQIARGFNRTIAKGVACVQLMLTPGNSPFGLTYSIRPILFSTLFLVSGLWTSIIPRCCLDFPAYYMYNIIPLDNTAKLSNVPDNCRLCNIKKSSAKKQTRFLSFSDVPNILEIDVHTFCMEKNKLITNFKFLAI